MPVLTPTNQNYLDIAWLRIDRENIGKPTSSEIKINEEIASSTVPQAWSNILDGVESWYYNWPGALLEAKERWKRVPTIEEWMKITNAIDWENSKKLETLNIPLTGYRNAWIGKIANNLAAWTYAYAHLWSSSSNDSEKAFTIHITPNASDVSSNFNLHDMGLSVRLILDK